MSPEATTEVPSTAGVETEGPGAAGAKAQAAAPSGAPAGGSVQPGAGTAGPGPAGAGGPELGGVEFHDIASVGGAGSAEAPHGDPERNIELLRDVTLRVKVELGRGKMYLRDVLRLTEGSVVELDKLAGDPLEIYVNDRLVGKGEVLVLNENFCIRITQIFSPEECVRIKGIA